jgi:hypothetical protein
MNHKIAQQMRMCVQGQAPSLSLSFSHTHDVVAMGQLLKALPHGITRNRSISAASKDTITALSLSHVVRKASLALIISSPHGLTPKRQLIERDIRSFVAVLISPLIRPFNVPTQCYTAHFIYVSPAVDHGWCGRLKLGESAVE